MGDPPDRSRGPESPSGKPEVHITLLEDEARYRAVVEEQTELLCRWLPDGRLTFVNKAYCRYFGKKREELLGTSFLSFLPEEERESAEWQIAELFASLSPEKPSMTFEHRIDSASGGVRWQLWTDRAIFDKEGRLVELQSVGRDITERKTMEEALRTRVRQQAAVAEFGLKALSGPGLPALMEEAVAVIVRLMGFETGGVLEHDAAMKKLVLRVQVGLGKEAVGRLALDAAPDNPAGHTFLTGRPAIVEDLRTDTAFGSFSNHDFIRKSGVLSGINVLIAGSAGRPLGVFGGHNRRPRIFSADDVHFLQSMANILGTAMERASTEKALREGEERFRELADLLPQVVFETDLAGNLTFVNRMGQAPFGITPDDLAKGLSPLEMIVPEDRDRVRENMTLRLSGSGSVGNEYTALRRDGSTLPIAVYSAPIVRNGEVAGLRGILIDITERKRAEASLRETTEALQAVIEASPVAIGVIDPESRITLWNPAAETIFGWKKEEVLGRPVRTVPEDLKETFGGLLRRAFAGERFVNIEGKGLRKDGTRVSLLISTAPLRDARGAISGTLGIFTDITDRKRAERSWRESEERFRMAVDHFPHIFVIYDKDLRFRFINAVGKKILGFTKDEEYLGRINEEIYPPEITGRYLPVLRRVAESRKPETFEADLPHPPCNPVGTITLAITYIPLLDQKGGLLQVLGMCDDVTDRKRAEAALTESVERFRSLVKDSLVGFSIIQDGRIVFMNPEQERILGQGAEGLAVDDLCERAIHPEDRERFLALVRGMERGTGGREAADIRFIPPGDGTKKHRTVWTQCRISPVRWQGRDALLINTLDVTQTKEMENLALVQEKMATLGQVAAGIAHEIRNPLSGLNIYLSSIEQVLDGSEGLEPDRREMTRRMAEQAKAASAKVEGVIRRVMDFARPAPLRLSPVQINRAIGEAVELAQVVLRRSGISLESRLAGDLPPCLADENLIEQVILNLITNAAQAMEGQEREKRIEIESSAVEDRVAISIGDSGPGVPPQIRNRIFEPFYTTKSQGTGIGLSFCQKVMADHGGRLTVGTSRLGGAEFRIEIPCGESAPKD